MGDAMPNEAYPTGLSVREACRAGTCTSVTSGLAQSYIQANLIVLPSRYATDFRLLCLRNPVPCPLIGESKAVGERREIKSWLAGVLDYDLVADLDIARDCPKYMIYEDGALISYQSLDITQEWTSDHVAFLIGCSYSFETALTRAGLTPPHILRSRNVSMYRTNIPLCAAGVFKESTYVVSLRAYRKSQVEEVREITRPFVATHGEPIAWGWSSAKNIGISDINKPEWGDPPVTPDGKSLMDVGGDDPWIPVFWGCGVTPQEAVQKAQLDGTIMGHVRFMIRDPVSKLLMSITAGTRTYASS